MSESLLPFEPMGVYRFLLDGIERYQREHDGELPSAFALHPDHLLALDGNRTTRVGPEGLNMSRVEVSVASLMALGVPGMRVDCECTVPYLLDAAGNCYEL